MTTRITIDVPSHIEKVYWEFHDKGLDGVVIRNRGGSIGAGAKCDLYIHNTRQVVISETPLS